MDNFLGTFSLCALLSNTVSLEISALPFPLPVIFDLGRCFFFREFLNGKDKLQVDVTMLVFVKLFS